MSWVTSAATDNSITWFAVAGQNVVPIAPEITTTIIGVTMVALPYCSPGIAQ